MGALLWARAGVGGRPGGPRDTHGMVQEGPEEAARRAPGIPLPCAGDRSPWAPRERASLSRASTPVEPVVRNAEGARNPLAYDAVLDQFNVAVSPRYEIKADKKTH